MPFEQFNQRRRGPNWPVLIGVIAVIGVVGYVRFGLGGESPSAPPPATAPSVSPAMAITIDPSVDDTTGRAIVSDVVARCAAKGPPQYWRTLVKATIAKGTGDDGKTPVWNVRFTLAPDHPDFIKRDTIGFWVSIDGKQVVALDTDASGLCNIDRGRWLELANLDKGDR